MSVAGFQLGSKMITRLAPVTLSPTPPHLHKYNKISNNYYCVGIFKHTIITGSLGGGGKGGPDMFQYFSTVLYVHVYLENSREGKSTSGVGNSCTPPPSKINHTESQYEI